MVASRPLATDGAQRSSPCQILRAPILLKGFLSFWFLGPGVICFKDFGSWAFGSRVLGFSASGSRDFNGFGAPGIAGLGPKGPGFGALGFRAFGLLFQALSVKALELQCSGFRVVAAFRVSGFGDSRALLNPKP